MFDGIRPKRNEWSRCVGIGGHDRRNAQNDRVGNALAFLAIVGKANIQQRLNPSPNLAGIETIVDVENSARPFTGFVRTMSAPREPRPG